MRNFLFSLRTLALLLVSLAFVVFFGTMAFHATAEGRMRLDFVSDHLLGTARLIAARQNHVIEHAQQYLDFIISACPQTPETLAGRRSSEILAD